MNNSLALYPLVRDWEARRIFTHYRDALKTISYQIESVILTRNIHARVFAGFQRFSFFLPRVQQYTRLGQVADGVWVFGLPDVTPPSLPGVTFVPLTPDDPLVDEWFLVVDDPSYFSALVAQEIRNGECKPHFERQFRGVWTFDEKVVNQLQRTLSQSLSLKALPTNGSAPPRDYQRQLTQVAYSANALVNALENKNQQLTQAQRLREDLVNMLVHDMRNPLAAILSNLELVQNYQDRMSKDELNAFLHSALVSANDLNHMIGDLLDIARMEEGRLQLIFQEVDPTVLLSRAAGAVKKMLGRNVRQIEVNVSEPLPAVLCEPEKIGRVLDNLLSNALKYTQDGGRIVLSAQMDDGYVRFMVCDDGMGIPKEAQERIFEKFEQVGGKGQRRGTGLGLAFCKMIVEAHGGRIWVESEPGRGSTFMFTLPTA